MLYISRLEGREGVLGIVRLEGQKGARASTPVGAMEPTASPMEEAVKDSRQVMPMNRANLHEQISHNKQPATGSGKTSTQPQQKNLNQGEEGYTQFVTTINTWCLSTALAGVCTTNGNQF